MSGKKRKESGLDNFLRESMKEDAEFRTLFFAEAMKLPIPTQIRVLRNFQGLSQMALSKRTRLVQPEIARLEKQGSNPRIQTLERLAKGLGARVELVPERLLPHMAAEQVRDQGEAYFAGVAMAAR